jgi:hypothetical protein
MASECIIKFGSNAKSTDVSDHSRSVLKKLMAASQVFEITITSTARDAYDQARVMYDNIASEGVEAQKALYGSAGDKVIDVYTEAVKSGKDRNGTVALMKAKILELGPSKVSNHATDVSKLNVFDVAPSGIPADKKNSWEDAIKKNLEIKKYIFPPTDPGYHFEIEQPSV